MKKRSNSKKINKTREYQNNKDDEEEEDEASISGEVDESSDFLGSVDPLDDNSMEWLSTQQKHITRRLLIHFLFIMSLVTVIFQFKDSLQQWEVVDMSMKTLVVCATVDHISHALAFYVCVVLQRNSQMDQQNFQVVIEKAKKLYAYILFSNQDRMVYMKIITDVYLGCAAVYALVFTTQNETALIIANTYYIRGMNISAVDVCVVLAVSVVLRYYCFQSKNHSFVFPTVGCIVACYASYHLQEICWILNQQGRMISGSLDNNKISSGAIQSFLSECYYICMINVIVICIEAYTILIHKFFQDDRSFERIHDHINKIHDCFSIQ